VLTRATNLIWAETSFREVEEPGGQVMWLGRGLSGAVRERNGC